MKPSKTFQAIITKLAAKHGLDLTTVGSHLRLTMPNYQPLTIEVIGEHQVAVAHTYRQHGDVMFDPEMVFYTGYGGNGWLAIRWRNDGVHVDQVSVVLSDGVPARYSPRMQADHAAFAAMWARNLKVQNWLTSATVDHD